MSQLKIFVLVGVWMNLLLISNSHPTTSFMSYFLGLVEKMEQLSETLPVGSIHNPGKSCRHIQANGGTESKNYYLKLGMLQFQVYCDQTTAGGGWTLVHSYTFTNVAAFNHFSNAITPRPSWAAPGTVPVSTTPPMSETDYNAMDFNLWNQLGSEFMIKSNINNWIACLEGTGSLINWRDGSLQCRLVKNYMGMCADIVPDTIQLWMGTWAGPNISKNMETPTLRAYYYLEAATRGNREWPTHDPCGIDMHYKYPDVANPHGNIYIR